MRAEGVVLVGIVAFIVGLIVGAAIMDTGKSECAAMLSVAHTHADSLVIRQTARGDCRLIQ